MVDRSVIYAIIRYTNVINQGGKMATKETLYKYYAHVETPAGKSRHLFTNDTVARTKVLQKNGINMDSVKWIAIEPARTKEQFLNGDSPAVESHSAEAEQNVA
ncbi:MAG: hypothetical protein CBC05_02550 [Crocinitomicaceae bacterium TMED45]|nr:MAG: hypothetical protein CBC05_02550 [Crocinitomicaceae bacterium TMED45]